VYALSHLYLNSGQRRWCCESGDHRYGIFDVLSSMQINLKFYLD
jgi:hypothetical protein